MWVFVRVERGVVLVVVEEEEGVGRRMGAAKNL